MRPLPRSWLRWLVTLVLLGLASAALAAPPAKGKKGKKPTAEELEEQEELFDKQQRDTFPGFFRWWDALSLGQVKINAIDTSIAPKLRLFISVLYGGKSTVLTAADDWEKEVRHLEVKVASGEEKTPKRLLTVLDAGSFVAGKDTLEEEEKPRSATLQPLDKAKIGVDVVVVAAGHGGFRTVENLESAHRTAVGAVLKKLAKQNLNVIWYGPALYTYRSFPGLENDLSRFDEDRKQCDIDLLKWRMDQSRELKEGETAAPPPPCGLHSGDAAKAIGAAVESVRFRGKHARLFGIPVPKEFSCTRAVQSTTDIQLFDMDEVADRTADTGAFEEALRLLVHYGKPGNRKVLLYLGDGRDGYVDDETTCRQFFTTSKLHCATAGDGKKGEEAKKAIQGCVQSKLDKRATGVQERFKLRAQNWLALARSADVRVMAVGYALERPDGGMVSQRHERERLGLLAEKTGGTYREVTNVNLLTETANATVDEVLRERVLTIDANLKSLEHYRIVLSAVFEHGETSGQKGTVELSTVLYEFDAPEIPSGWQWWLKQKNAWLKEKVGTILYWVIVVAAIILVLLILWLILKLFIAAFKKLFGGLFKKAGDAAKKAGDVAKKGGDVAKGAGKAASDAAKKSAGGAAKGVKGK